MRCLDLVSASHLVALSALLASFVSSFHLALKSPDSFFRPLASLSAGVHQLHHAADLSNELVARLDVVESDHLGVGLHAVPGRSHQTDLLPACRGLRQLHQGFAILLLNQGALE